MWKNMFSLMVTTSWDSGCLKSLMVYILQAIYSKSNYISESIMGWLENQCSDGFGGEEQRGQIEEYGEETEQRRPVLHIV